MKNKNSKKEIRIELDEIEANNEYKKTDYIDLNNISCDDSVKMYFNEIIKYDLLSDEEEYKYSKNIHIADELDITKKSIVQGCIKIDLNLTNLFLSFSNISCYDQILRILLDFYKHCNNNGDKKVYSILKKYDKKTIEKGRSLNYEEVSNLIDIDSDNIKYLNGIELITQIKKFLLYKNSYDKMFYCNLRLVVSVAKKFNTQNDLLDNINEGNLGLMKAIDMYNPDLGYKFSTYAVWWIKQKIARSIHESSRLIRYPVHISENINKLKMIRKKYSTEFSRVPTIAELSKELNLPESKVNEILKYEYDVVSLSTPVGESEDSVLEDFISDTNSVEDTVDKVFLKDDINYLLEGLSEKEINVLKLRFGLNKANGNGMTLESVANVYGVSRERIRQIEEKALRKVRGKSFRNSKKRAIKEYLI